MAQNKKNIKKPRIYNPQVEKFKKENHIRNKIKPIFKMSKRTKAIITLLAAVAGAAQLTIEALAAVNSEITQPKEKYKIGVSGENATISSGRKEHKIDANSFVIILGNEALAYDENGNIQKGEVIGEVQEVCTMTEEEMSKYNIYQVTSQDGANVRATGTIEDDNIVSRTGYQDYVLGYSTTTEEHDGEWVSTLSVSGDNLYEGYIREDLIQQVGNVNLIYDNINEILMKVNTSKDGNINLNLRSKPGELDKMFIMSTIPNASIVRLIEQKTAEDNRSWSYVEYQEENGENLQGWVVSDYLTTYYTPEQSKENTGYSQDEIINQTGNVTGIDVSTISPNKLRQVLQSGIPNNVDTTYGNVNTSQVAGDINFVYIKLGASTYGKGDLKTVDYDSYKEQVKICEEMGVPYGFYYYSTSTTVEEANTELATIKKRIQDLQKEVDMKNNKLEIVVDIELAGKNDRQYRGNIKEQTRAKATLINGIQEAGLSDNVLVYGPMRVMKPDLDQIISLPDLHSMLSNPDDVNLWLCSPTSKDGQESSKFNSNKQYAEQSGFDVVATQIVLDGNVIGRIDINNMTREHYCNMVENTREIIGNKNVANQNNGHDER